MSVSCNEDLLPFAIYCSRHGTLIVEVYRLRRKKSAAHAGKEISDSESLGDLDPEEVSGSMPFNDFIQLSYNRNTDHQFRNKNVKQ